ncbi:MAG TPA: plasmid partitioning protein RepB C-terminal domain-containing protein [Opitutaceae bacterium]|nr:plasmid partitioning protein RepB C-terminal domain-containing protein [Opitutaceae bacterium]
MKSAIKAAFELAGVNLPLAAIHPIRQVKPADAAFGKYKSVLASIREVGVIEPLIVYPQRGSKTAYFLLDGHMRLKALHELGRTEAFCLISKDDDAFTYNDKVNRLSLIQEHAMIIRAMDQGVTPEQIAKALEVDVGKIRANINLLEGIHPDVVDLLKDKPITATALRLFRKVKAVRQIDMAQLMITGANYTRAYADALIIGTPAEQLVKGSKKEVPGVSHEEIVRMEKEMETLERDYRLHQEQFGENSLHLNAAQRHVKRLLENPKIKRFLGNRYPEILEEFQELVALECL